MTLIEIINKLKTYAEGQYNNPKVLVGSLYENLNTKELTYPCINIDNANAMKRENEIVYNFYIYYADRLSESGDNMLQIQSEATTALQLMLHKILDAGSINLDDFYNVVITPFKLKFTDVCAGAWMQVNVHAVGLDVCDDISQINTLYITVNGNYEVDGYERVDVNVSGESGSNIVEISKEEYDALVSAGTIDENTLYIISGYTDNYELGYASGWTDGYNTSSEGSYQSGYTSGYTDGFQSGYTSGHTDGYNEGTADGFGSGYTSGYTDGYQVGYEEGEESVPLTSTSITENGVFSPSEGGWNEVEVNVSTGITPSGEIEITENGIYDVYNKATANVEIPVWDYYQSGYTSGYTDGFQSGYTSGETDGFQSGYTSGNTDGFQSGYTSGHTDGYNEGVEEGFTSGYTSGYTDGYQIGESDGFQSGYTSGYTNGYTSGETDGFQSGFTSGYTSGNTDGFQSGYTSGHTDGYSEGYTSGETVGFQSGYTSGYTSGHTDGYNEGYTSGETDGFQSGYTSGHTDGYNEGYEDGEQSVPLTSTSITSNGVYVPSEGGWNSVTVNVPTGITPTGQTNILTNGTYDVTNVATAVVTVPQIPVQVLTQAEFNALTTKDPNTVYVINN